jgi:hypothetical protein
VPAIRSMDGVRVRKAAWSFAVMAVGVVTGCSGDDDLAAPPSGPGVPTIIDPAPEPATLAVASTVNPPQRDDGCRLPTPSTWVRHGSYHTVPPAQAPVTARVVATDANVCPGGTVGLRVTFRNRGAVDHVIESPVILLHGGIDKWSVAGLGRTVVAAGSSLDVDATATLPLVAPGEYGLVVYQYGPGGRITVSPPG